MGSVTEHYRDYHSPYSNYRNQGSLERRRASQEPGCGIICLGLGAVIMIVGAFASREAAEQAAKFSWGQPKVLDFRTGEAATIMTVTMVGGIALMLLGFCCKYAEEQENLANH